jgi:hypothetical protein
MATFTSRSHDAVGERMPVTLGYPDGKSNKPREAPARFAIETITNEVVMDRLVSEQTLRQIVRSLR